MVYHAKVLEKVAKMDFITKLIKADAPGMRRITSRKSISRGSTGRTHITPRVSEHGRSRIMLDVNEAIQAGKTALGIEFGSTNIKGVLVDEKGQPPGDRQLWLGESR